MSGDFNWADDNQWPLATSLFCLASDLGIMVVILNIVASIHIVLASLTGTHRTGLSRLIISQNCPLHDFLLIPYRFLGDFN